MKDVCVIGHFGFGQELLNGQTVKTKIITKELEEQFGADKVLKVDTHGGKKTMLKLVFQIGKMAKNCKNIAMMPAHNGVRFFAPLLCFWKRVYHVKLHYIVIGGWLPEFIENKKYLQKSLKKFDVIYVETDMMKKSLEEQGFKNIFVMPNCKELSILTEGELVYSEIMPLRLCTFSRVLKEKGIEDAIEAVQYINKKYNKEIFSLDIYGQIDENYVERFEEIQKGFPSYIQYKGLVSYDKSVEVLKEYYALLFPTYYSGEGFAGTLIDALAAGLPVIASDWRYNSELVEENKTGLLFQAGDVSALIEKLEEVSENPDICNKMKLQCLKRAYEYLPSNAIKIFFKNME